MIHPSCENYVALPYRALFPVLILAGSLEKDVPPAMCSISAPGIKSGLKGCLAKPFPQNGGIANI